MSVEKTHPDYDYMSPLWTIMRDTYAGQRAIHAAGTAYLPRLSGQSNADYTAYKSRAVWHNAVKRTIGAMVGMAFRKPPVVMNDDTLTELLENLDLNYTSAYTMAKMMMSEIITVGRVGVLIDYNTDAPDVVSLDQAMSEGRRAYATMYEAEAITNWRTEIIAGKPVLTMAVLREKRQTYVGFEVINETIYRVLLLDQGVYRVQVYSKVNDKDYVLESEVTPIKNGAPLSYIPFYIYGINGQQITPIEPPLYDLACLNISHYQTTADLEHGAHFTALPTAVVTGHTLGDGESLSIGSQAAWVFSNDNAKANFLEFTGQGLGALENRLAKKEEQMAAQGARMLSPDKAVAEAAQTEIVRRAGELSFLSSITVSVSELMTEIIQECADWMGLNADEFSYVLTRDFMPAKMTPQELTAWVSALQTGAVSQQTFFEALQEGEMVGDTLTYEEEEGRRETQRLALPPVADNEPLPMPETDDSDDQEDDSEDDKPLDLTPIVDAIKGIKIEIPAAPQPVVQQAPDASFMPVLASMAASQDLLAAIIAKKDESVPDLVGKIQETNAELIDRIEKNTKALLNDKEISYDNQGRIIAVKTKEV